MILAQYVSRHIKPNAEIDSDLTASLRLHKESVDALRERLVAGTIIVQKGERITDNTLALLADLKNAIDETRLSRYPDGSVGSPSWLPSILTYRYWTSVNGWIVGFCLALAVAVAVWTTSYLTRSKTRLPAIIPDSEEGGFEGDEDAVLVRALRDRTVQALYSQHQEFLAHERSATELLKDFEQRIATLEPRAQEKIRRYELRIEELERQLADREEENRELIRNQIENTRREIARELIGAGFENN